MNSRYSKEFWVLLDIGNMNLKLNTLVERKKTTIDRDR